MPRRRLFDRFVALASVGVVLAWCGPLAPRAASAAEPEAGVVARVQGDTWLIRNAFVSSPLRQSAGVRAGDKLVTGADGRIEIQFADSARVSIGPRTEFKVDDYKFDAQAQRSFFTLVRGAIHQVSGQIGKRNGDDYRLTTPTGVLAIRGTEFKVDETVCPRQGCGPSDKPGMAVEVIQGRVAVTNGAGTIEVPAGAAIHLADARAPAVFTRGNDPRRPAAPRRVPSAGGGQATEPGGQGLGGSERRLPNLY
jgi:hypothetical protein